jgi:hypothetical protein
MYTGQALRSIPSDYLAWSLRTCKLSTPLRTAVRAELLSRHDCPRLPPEPTPKPLLCPERGSADARLYWQEQASGRKALRADCAQCGSFIKFAAQTKENVALAAQTMAAGERERHR